MTRRVSRLIGALRAAAAGEHAQQQAKTSILSIDVHPCTGVETAGFGEPGSLRQAGGQRAAEKKEERSFNPVP
jgi:hypothetical protein